MSSSSCRRVPATRGSGRRAKCAVILVGLPAIGPPPRRFLCQRPVSPSRAYGAWPHAPPCRPSRCNRPIRRRDPRVAHQHRRPSPRSPHRRRGGVSQKSTRKASRETLITRRVVRTDRRGTTPHRGERSPPSQIGTFPRRCCGGGSAGSKRPTRRGQRQDRGRAGRAASGYRQRLGRSRAVIGRRERFSSAGGTRPYRSGASMVSAPHRGYLGHGHVHRGSSTRPEVRRSLAPGRSLPARLPA